MTDDRPMDSDCWLPDLLFERWRASSPRPPLQPDDLAEAEGRCFVHALLPFPLQAGGTFRVGLWLEVDGLTFRRVRRAHGSPAAWRALSLEGVIANDIHLFGTRLLGVRVRARPQAEGIRPAVVEVLDPKLAALVRRGWTETEYRQVVGAVEGAERAG